MLKISLFPFFFNFKSAKNKRLINENKLAAKIYFKIILFNLKKHMKNVINLSSFIFLNIKIYNIN